MQEQGVLPRNTDKQMRAALKEHVGSGTYVHPVALFALSPAEIADLAKRHAEDVAPDTDAPEPASPDESEGDEVPDDAPEDEDPDTDADPDLLPPPVTDLPEQHLGA